MWYAYLYRRAADATQWIPDPDEVAAAETEADCVTALLEVPWDVTYELGVDALPPPIADIRPQIPAPVPRMFARVDTDALWTPTYEYIGVVEDPDAPAPLPPNPLPREPLEEHSVQAVHLLPEVGTPGQILLLDASAELSWQDPGTIALEDGSVTHAKLASNAVEAINILDGTITTAKLAAGVLPAPPPAASDTTAGLIQLATTAEVQAGTDTTKAVTPGRLVGRTATETRTGLVELATTAEATAGTDTQRAVTPAGLEARIAAIPAIPNASEATPGILRLATQPEVTTGTDDTKAVTPLKLAGKIAAIPAVPVASDTIAGIVELATPTETTAGTDATRAVTPAGLAAKLPAGTPLSVVRYAASGTALETGSASVVIDGSGQLGIGTATPSALLSTVGGNWREVRDGASATFTQETFISGAGAGNTWITVRGYGTAAAREAIPANVLLFGMLARGMGDATVAGDAVSVYAYSDEAFTPTARGGRLVVSTTQQGTTTLTERLRLDSRGNHAIGGKLAGTEGQKVLVLASGVAPTAAHPTDAVQLWTADRAGTAGKGSLHLRTEDGTSHVFGDVVGIGTVAPNASAMLSINGSLIMLGQSSVQERAQAFFATSWVDSTDATRKALLRIYAYDTANREGIRIQASGTAAMLGFYGVNAVARQTVPAAATDAGTTQTLANALRSALITLGLCV